MRVSDYPPQARIREFLKVRTSYDVLPLSFRLIVLDNDLLIKKSLTILTQNGERLRRGMDDRDTYDLPKALCRLRYGTLAIPSSPVCSRAPTTLTSSSITASSPTG